MRRTCSAAWRAAVALALVAVVLAPGSAPQAAGPCTATADAGGGWLSSRPTFAAGPAAVTLAVSPAFAPDVVYATNGAVISRSEDGGCTWAPAFAATAVRGPAGTARITSLAAPSSASSSSFVYAGITVDVADGVSLPRVVSSEDRFKSWVVSEATSGLPLTGSVVDVVPNALLPQTAYAVVAVQVSGGSVSGAKVTVYATNDAGVTWAERSSLAEGFSGDQLTANPLTQTQLFAVGGRRVTVSEDGAATFARTKGDSGMVGALSLATGSGGVRLAAARMDANAVSRSDDAGATWRTLDVPVRARDLAMAPLQDQVAVADDTDVYLVSLLGAFRLSPTGGAPDQLTISAPTAAGVAVTGVRRGEVLRITLTAGDSPTFIPPELVGGVLRPVRLLPPGTLGQFPSLLLPAGLRVSLPAGGSKRVPYQLVVPRTPTPVDLMFLIDTTGSMGPVIDGLRQDLGRIVKVLDTAGLDARYGVADFKDYGRPNDAFEYPYRLRRIIGPNDDSLTAALNSLQASGGGDGPESSVTALLQSTTGEGQPGFVEPGGQAQYRAQAFKLALIAADTRFHRAGDSYSPSSNGLWPGPDFDRTVAVLERAGVHQIGLAASPEPISDMQAFALGTDALAPKGGVDCDGNGLVDVAAGGPLVCELQSQVAASPINGPGAGGATALAGAVVSAANGIADPQRVSLTISRGDKVARLAGLPRRGAPVPKAAFVATSAATVLNLKADNELAYELELRCPVAAPASYPITLTAATANRTLTTGTVQLDCGGPVAAPGLPALAAPAAAAAAAQAAAPGPAQPVQQPAPNPNPNPNPQANANPNANPQAGAAEQEEANAQLALAMGEMPESESLAMSAREAGFVGSAGLLLCAATAVAVRRRTQLSCT